MVKVDGECSGSDDAKIILEVTPDIFASETSWDIQDTNGNIVESGNALTYDPFTQYDHTYCVSKAGCYSFTMYDSYYDGIDCSLDECYKVSYEPFSHDMHFVCPVSLPNSPGLH